MKYLFTFLIAAFAALMAGAQTPDRSKDPVVVRGSDLPCLTSMANLSPDDVLGFRFDGTQLIQIPIQIDEVLVDKIEAPWGPNGCRGSKKNVTWDVPFYADANTYAGADPDPSFDQDDELAFMARDAGSQLNSCVAQPAGTVGDPCELALQDPITNASLGYVYLFRKSGNISPAAGANLVSYNFSFANNYLQTYDECNGVNNQENSTISTDNYFLRFTGRWTESEVKILAPGANGLDILDRHQAFIRPGLCSRTEEIFSATNGPVIASIDGPVRAIRSVMGAVSGAYIQLDIVCTENRVDYDFDYRLHSVSGGGGFHDVWDLEPGNTSGMQFYSASVPNGVTINGVADAVPTTYSTWQLITGAPGSVVAGFDYDTDMSIGTPMQQGQGFAEGGVGSYYDDGGSNGIHLCSGDGQAFGSSGFFLTTDLCTDRKHGGIGCGPNVRTFSESRSHYYLPPGITPTQAQSYAEFARNPIQVSSAITSLASLCGGNNFTVTTSSAPSNGGTTSGGGTYASGSNVTVTASPASGFTFSNWTEGGNVVSSSASYTFSLSGNRNLVANFSSGTANFTVTTSSAPSNGGTTSGGGTYASGSNVTVTATPASGFSFANWTENGNTVSANPSYSFVLNGNRNLTANFNSSSSNNYELTLIPKPSNGGTVSGAGTYPAGTQVTAMATPASGYIFQAWVINGAVQSTNPVYSFQLNSNRKLKAKFRVAPSSKQDLAVVDPTSEILVYPNPGQGKFYIQSTETYTLRVRNALGQLVYERQHRAGNSSFELPQNGIYLLEFWQGNLRKRSQRLVVQE